MPIFEYQCFECGSKFEELVLGQRKTAASCKQCGSGSVERLLSTFAAHSSSPAPQGACANKAGGVCQAGGGSIPCGTFH